MAKADVNRNEEITLTRSGCERPFVTYKSRYELARTRLLSLAINLTFYGQAAIAYNIQKDGFKGITSMMNRNDGLYRDIT